jgi:hypothetical protein
MRLILLFLKWVGLVILSCTARGLVNSFEVLVEVKKDMERRYHG